MAYFYLVPQWFFGFGVAMEVLFGIISLIVSFYAYKIFKITNERNVKHFSIGFLLIGLSYVIWALSNIFVATNISNKLQVIDFSKIQFIGSLGIYSYIFLFVFGLVSLAYANLKVQKGEVYYLLLGLSLLVIAVSLREIATFRILSIFLLSFIVYNYLIEYNKNKNKRINLTLISFSLLLISNIDFMFAGQYYQTYIIGHILELCAYSLILVNLIKTIKK